ncbi:AmmeMemoRadiSam system protein B [Thermocrinis sp.]
MKVRKPTVAGSFYPRDPEKLRETVYKLLGNASSKVPVGVIAPHAGYAYSGKVAGKVYGLFRGSKGLSFLLIGPSHFVDFVGISFGDYEFFETPLGLVKVDRDRIEAFLMKFNPPRALDNLPHLKEHSLEVQLPFLQVTMGEFSIIPVLYGRVKPEFLLEVIEFFCEYGTCFVISSDLSHYYTDEIARRIDAYCHEGITKLDQEILEKCEACGKVGILSVLMWSKRKNLRPELVAYATSADAYGNRDMVVGYGGYAFFS